MLTAEELRERVHYEAATGVFTWIKGRRVGKTAGFPHGDGYLAIRIGPSQYLCHRLAWLYVYGGWPERDIDHRDQVRDNNRITNLRLATKSQNSQNVQHAYRNGSSGFRGVSLYAMPGRPERWRARIQLEGKTVYLGYFDTAEAASAAYEAARPGIHTFLHQGAP